jgi:hypothetical protein
MAGFTAAGVAAIINTLLFFIFHAMGVFTDDIFIQPNQPLSAVPIIISSTMPTIIASLVFFLFEKYSNNGFKNFRILSLILLVISFVNPFMGIKGVTIPFALALDFLHIPVVAALLFFIGKSIKSNKA